MTRRVAATLVAGLALVGGGGWAARRLFSFQPAVVPATTSAALATEWYYADGITRADGAPDEHSGVSSSASEWILILNLSRLPALATATFFFEDLPPRTTTILVPGHGRRNLRPDDLPDVVPAGVRHGVRVTATQPIVVQSTRADYTPHGGVTFTMASLVAHPGPLGTHETKWAYADGLVVRSGEPRIEREWITIMNPDAGRDAAVTVRFLFNDGRTTHALVVPAERIRSLDLSDVPGIRDDAPFGVVVDSDTPVVVEQVRRVYRPGDPSMVSMFACLAHPIGGSDGPLSEDPVGSR